MNQAGKPDHTNHDPATDADHLTQEADIGSGERSPGQKETDEAIKSIPPLPDDGQRRPAPTKP